MEYILSILSGGASGAIVIWLLKGWILERVKQSIKAEYDEKLERFKTSLSFREKALELLVEIHDELSKPVDISTAIDSIKTKNKESVLRYIGEKKDEYNVNQAAYKKIRYLFDSFDQEKLDAALDEADTNDAQVLEQLLDGPDNVIMPGLVTQFLNSTNNFRDLFMNRLNARINYISSELLGGREPKT